MYSNFEWPIPPGYEFVPGDDFSGPEPAHLTLGSGRKLQGSLTRFLPAHRIIEFLPPRGRANLDIPFADIVQLRLTRAVLVRRRPSQFSTPESGAKGVETQPFRIDLQNGDTLSGDTVGYQIQPAGTFLFLANYGETVIRAFVPQGAVKNQQIGKPIGELLVDSKLLTETQVQSGLARQRELRRQRIGDILTELQVISQDQLQSALDRQRSMPIIRLGEALVESKRISAEQLANALELQKEKRQKQLGEILIDLGCITRPDLYRALSQKLGIPAIDLEKFNLDLNALKAMPEELAREFQVFPVGFDGNALVVAMSNPLDPAPIEKIRFTTQRPVRPVLALPEAIEAAIQEHYGVRSADKSVADIAKELAFGIDIPAAGVEDENIKETDNTLVRLVNKIIMDAHATGASDVHIESHAGKRNVGIRFRRDGTLSEYLQVPYNFRQAILSRVKIMAGLDISERRRAQDGRINFRQFGPADVELRVATIPTSDGLEDAVMRVLNAGEPIPLAKLEFREPVKAAVEELLGRSFGMFLVVGPTGSGKTTTLHSLLGVLNAPERKIWTAEDPIEITQPGLRQVQVHSKIGWTFAAALRSFLRGDPDVVMVGEMRDVETASVAIEASLTGHLVFSTLHTNSAPETVVRLLEMGMDPFSFADSLAGILAQRLARKLCDECKSSRPLTDDELQLLVREYCQGTSLQEADALGELRGRHGDRLVGWSAPGCDACRKSGYRGRVGLHELLVMDPGLRQLVQRRAPAMELRAAALQSGMRTLRQDGIEKCLQGLTDMTEVRSVAT